MSRSNIRLGGIGGRVFLSLFFLCFFAMGLFFTVFMGRQLYRGVQTYSWARTECYILQSGVTDEGGSSPYVFNAQYQYQWQGVTHTSARVAHQKPAFSDYSKALRLAGKFQPENTAFCYINPKQPSEAILQRGSLWFAFALLLPLLFVAIGAGGIYATWKARKPAPPAPILVKPRAAKSGKPALAFYLLFFLVGGIVSWFIVVRPAIRIFEARGWDAVPCHVLSSRVQYHEGNDSTTYSVDILYSYVVNGREYKANRYQFLGGSSSGREGKLAIVRQYPPGSTRICYVNPRDPTDAVLNRGFTPMMLIGLVPLAFLAIGSAGLLGRLRPPKSSTAVAGPKDARTPVALKPKASPAAKFIGLFCLSLFWNGIVSVFVYQCVRAWITGRGDDNWFLTLFLIPFVLIGLLIVVGAIHSFFGLFSPRAQLRIDSDTVVLGGNVEIQWKFSGRIEKLRDFRLILEGCEERDTGSGKKRRTSRTTFYTGEIVHLTNFNDIKSGSALCTIPQDQPVSDAEGSHRTHWAIRLKAEVERGADLNDEYPITVVSSTRSEPASTIQGYSEEV